MCTFSVAQVVGFVGAENAAAAMEGADIIVIPAGVPRKPGMTRDDLFGTNASIVQGLAKAAAECVQGVGLAGCCCDGVSSVANADALAWLRRAAPNAHLCIISNPVNSTVPIVAETLKAAGTYDPRR